MCVFFCVFFSGGGFFLNTTQKGPSFLPFWKKKKRNCLVIGHKKQGDFEAKLSPHKKATDRRLSLSLSPILLLMSSTASWSLLGQRRLFFCPNTTTTVVVRQKKELRPGRSRRRENNAVALLSSSIAATSLSRATTTCWGGEGFGRRVGRMHPIHGVFQLAADTFAMNHHALGGTTTTRRKRSVVVFRTTTTTTTTTTTLTTLRTRVIGNAAAAIGVSSETTDFDEEYTTTDLQLPADMPGFDDDYEAIVAKVDDLFKVE